MAIHRLFDDLEIDWQRLSAPRGRAGGPARPKPPSLRSLTDQGLGSLPVLLRLYRLVVARGMLKDSEAGLLAFLATAAYCRRVGRRPAALFVHLLKERRFPASLPDEDWAHRALVHHLRRERGRCRFLKARDPGRTRPTEGPSNRRDPA